MNAATAHKPIVHFVGSIPLPDAETVFPHPGGGNRTTPQARAGRRNRHPQDLDPLPASRCWPIIRRSRWRAMYRRSNSSSGTERYCAKSRACA